MIYRTIKNKENVYMMLNRAAANDSRLSLKALGIHTYIMSKPDNWTANEVDITKSHADGKASVRAGVTELIEHGYMVRVQMRRNKVIIGWRIDTYESPDLNPHFAEGKAAAHVVEDAGAELDSDFQDVGNQNVELDSAFLDLEKQDLGKQDLGNRNHKDINNKEYLEEKSNAPLPLPTASQRAGLKRHEQHMIDGLTKQVESFGVNMKVFRILVDYILEKHGRLEVAGLGTPRGEEALRNARECALELLAIDKGRFSTTQGVEEIYASWVANDWRGKTLPTLKQLVEHAGMMKSNQVRKAALTTAQDEDAFSKAFFATAVGG